MRKALLEVNTNGDEKPNLLTIANKWNVPRTTLRRLRDAKLAKPLKMGPCTVLSNKEEKILVKRILELKDRGFPVTQEQLVSSVKVSFYRVKLTYT